MWLKPLGIRTVIIGIALIAVIVVGTLGIGYAIANNYSNQSLAPTPVFPRNENGQTYGSALDATSLNTEPDLIKAYGVDGTLGYVRSVDLEEGLPKTPQEALAQQRKAVRVRPIPLYADDGKTIIGVFNVVTGQGIEKSAGKENQKATSPEISPSTE